ncbi:MAG TPA: hypothetical protein VK438_04095 [Xanthobacteraceae bacterium]|nr:hypothetical protein [Xanthobacteraceae bacterium]
MLSQSARATTPEEARFRVDYPNSTPRRIKIIALDRPAERVVRRLARGSWNAASFMTAVRNEGAPASGDWLGNLAGEALNLLAEISAADLVVTVSTAGESAEDAAIIAEVCNARAIMLTALVIDPNALPDAQLLRTVTPLRAHAAMLVVAKGEEYVDAMLTALRA